MSVEDIIITALVLESMIVAIGTSKAGAYILKLYKHVRKPTIEESARIEPLITAVAIQYNRILNTSYTTEYLLLNLSDSKFPSIYIYGQQYLVITTGLLMLISDGELKALIANQLGHAKQYDGVYALLKIFASMPLILSTWLFRFIRLVFNSFAKLNKLLLIAGIILSLILLPITLFGEIIRRVLLAIDVLFHKKCVYRADEFADQLGYKNDLISALNKLALLDEESGNIFQYLFVKPPNAKLRIAKLQSKCDNKYYIDINRSKVITGLTVLPGIDATESKEIRKDLGCD
jgi:Zn-dependent protease with chaperone function